MTHTHTKGPWKVTQILAASETRPKPKNYVGSTAYVWTDREYPKGCCVATVREELLGEAEANARLIAAAPGLLAALEHCLALADDAHFMEHPEWAEITTQARQALAKATGDHQANHEEVAR